MGALKTFVGNICLLLAGAVIGHAGTINTAELPVAERVAAIYTSQVGVREKTGHNDGVQVEAYLATTGLERGYAWCAAFVSWCFEQAHVDALRTAWAAGWFPEKYTIYQKGKRNIVMPARADVFGIYYPSLKRIGHVGFIDAWPAGDYMITVEGNTNTGGSREGDGVYRKRRLKTNVYKISRWVKQ